jgi:hypothetical protein
LAWAIAAAGRCVFAVHHRPAVKHRPETAAYRNDLFSIAFLSDENVGCAMYLLPFGDFDSVMDYALNITSLRTGQAVNFQEAQETAAQAY